MRKRLCIIAFLTIAVGNQSFAQHLKQDFLNLAYGKSKQNTLDLFLPENYTEKTPVILLLHGGAWMMGGKEYTYKTAKDLRDKGFIVANIDYRYVSDTVHGKDILGDIGNAHRYVQTISKKYQFKTSGYHISGISAGAHLALLYGYTTKKSIKSIAVLCAPTQLDNLATLEEFYKKKLISNIELLADANYDPGKKPDSKFTKVSPYFYIKKIPTLLFHGNKDEIVPFSQGEFLYKKLLEKKVQSKFVIMDGKGHDCGMNQVDSEKIVLDEISEWVKKYD